MELRSVRLPRSEALAFQGRASTFYPREIEDYLLGFHRRNGWDVRLILPTRIEDVEEHSAACITLRERAGVRAADTAAALGLSVLGSVHTHPFRYWPGKVGWPACGGGPMLSQTDYDCFASMAKWMLPPPIQGVCAVYRTGKHPDTWVYWWKFWRENSPVRVPFRWSRARS